KEIAIWSSLDHINVLPFKGFCFFPLGHQDSEDSLFSLVSPWMTHRTIRDYLTEHPKADRIALMIGITDGLNYLHGMDVVHADLKGGNIFITEKGEPVLADFGLSKLQGLDPIFRNDSITSSTSALKGTARFMAPELFGLDNPPDSKPPKPDMASDVWALGCVMLVRLNF
ncbi:kinase-like protein, partial [Sistotremastrum niveocremeum HHB9708]